MPRAGWVAVGAAAAAVAVVLGTAAHLSELGVGTALVFLAVAGQIAGIVVGRASRNVAAHGAAGGRSGKPENKAPSAVGPIVIGVAALAIRVIVAGTGDPVATSGLPANAGDGPWAARIVAIGSPRAGQQVATIDMEIGAPAVHDPRRMPLRVAATLPRYPTIRPGERVLVKGTLEAVADDDYGRYLSSTGVRATLRAVDVTVTGDAGDPDAILEGIRRSGDDALTRALPEPEAGLASGILIGLRDRVDRVLAAAFVAAAGAYRSSSGESIR